MLERRRVAAQYPPWTFFETVLIELLASRGKDGIALSGLFARVVAHWSQ